MKNKELTPRPTIKYVKELLKFYGISPKIYNLFQSTDKTLCTCSVISLKDKRFIDLFGYIFGTNDICMNRITIEDDCLTFYLYYNKKKQTNEYVKNILDYYYNKYKIKNTLADKSIIKKYMKECNLLDTKYTIAKQKYCLQVSILHNRNANVKMFCDLLVLNGYTIHVYPKDSTTFTIIDIFNYYIGVK